MIKKLVLIALLPLWGCATTKVANPDGLQGPKGSGTQVQTPGQPKPVEISNRAKLLFDDALKAFEAQEKARNYDYASLERKFQSAIDADPNLAEADYNLGVLSERQGKTDAAVAHYKAALKKKPTLRQAAENLAVISQNQGDVGGAVAMYRDILTKYPDDASSRARLAEVYRRQGDHDKAMEFAREALIREARTLPAYKVMMRSYLDRKQLSMAKLVALRAIKIDENDPELYHSVGLIQLAEKDPEAARLQFQKAVDVRADYLPAHVELARMSMKVEDYEGAEVHLRKILQADGKNAEAHLLLGVAYKGLGQYDKAMLEYDQAEKLDPKIAAVYLNRAILLHRHKDAPERALELYKRYLALSAEGVVDAESPVLSLVKEAEALVQAKAEAVAAEAEMKKQEAEAAKNAGKPNAQGEVQPAAGGEAAVAKPASQPAPVQQPAAPAPSADEPSEEPDDSL